MTVELDGHDCIVSFVQLLRSTQNDLSQTALAKTSAIESHIVLLAIRKLAVSSAKSASAFHTIETEQKKLAMQGTAIINNDLRGAA